MYANGLEPKPGDVVRGSGGEGKILGVISSGVVGQDDVLLEWTTARERVPGYSALKAPVHGSSQALTLMRRAI